MHIQSSSCDCERSFSKYKIIFEPTRQTMSEKTIKILNFLYFNCSAENCLDVEEELRGEGAQNADDADDNDSDDDDDVDDAGETDNEMTVQDNN